MRSSVIMRSLLIGFWLSALCALYMLGTLHVYAGTPVNCTGPCACKNVQVYKAIGAAPAGPTWYFKKNQDGSYSPSTQAFVSCFTTNNCDPTNSTQTTQTVYPQDGDAPILCNNQPTPGQTIYVECDNTVQPPPAPPPDADGVTRYVCAP